MLNRRRSSSVGPEAPQIGGDGQSSPAGPPAEAAIRPRSPLPPVLLPILPILPRLPRLPILPLLPLLSALALLLATPASASAQGMTRRFYGQPSYGLELEPHLVLGPANPPGPGVGEGAGVGFRGSIVVAHDGFIDNVNDAVAVGFGLDILHYPGDGASAFGTCVRRTPGPAGTVICTEVDTPGGPRNYLFIPVVMQWSFWLTPQWSVFGEPGLDVFFTGHTGGVTPSLAVGGRLQLSDAFTVVLRIGWPTTTVGVSFLF
jgi:hypothetical protein